MPAKTANLAIMFADISGSTKLYEDLGDVTGRHTVSECLELLSHIVRNYRGVVVKTIGDEVMCTFPTAEDGASAACEMHRQLGADHTGRSAESTSLSIRVGLHYGSAILEGRDVHGNAVIMAARMAAIAKADQTIMTEDMVTKLSDELRFNTRLIDHSMLKGMKDATDIYELTWQRDVTDMNINLQDQVRSDAEEYRLRLTYREQEIVVNDKRTEILLGRSSRCHVAVTESLASRQHVKLEWRRGKFFITDQSTNGTYIFQEGSQETFIRREQILLGGRGQISLGRAVNNDPTELISYCVEDMH